jgi:cob(I)alamin adenosyltransferase
MKIYTKTGDKGETSLVGGKRISKSELRIETFGTVDELNSWIGVLADYTINEPYKPFLLQIQSNLFTMGAILATEPGKKMEKIPVIHPSDVEQLEIIIDEISDKLTPLSNFILPSGHKEVSFAHVARTVSRRAERLIVRLHEEEPVDAILLQYMNRLSDFLFVFCREMSRKLGVAEVAWKP